MAERQTLGQEVAALVQLIAAQQGVIGRGDAAELAAIVRVVDACERLALACVANADASRKANRCNRRVVDYMNVYGVAHAFTRRAMDIEDCRAEDSWAADERMNEALAAFRAVLAEGEGGVTDNDSLSVAASRAEVVASRGDGFMMTVASGEASSLAEGAAALVALVRGMGGDGLPWWCRYEEDGVGFRCVCCRESELSSIDVAHDSACPAIRAEEAIRRIGESEGVR